MHKLLFEVSCYNTLHKKRQVRTTYRVYEHDRLEMVVAYGDKDVRDTGLSMETIHRWFLGDGDKLYMTLIGSRVEGPFEIELPKEVQEAYKNYIDTKFEEIVLQQPAGS